jgi:PhnB protein
MPVKPIPDGYHSLTPYLVVKGAGDAIDFYKNAFGATERMRLQSPDGKVGHAELDIGDSCFMLADEHPEMGAVGPETVGGTPVSLMIYCENVDQVFKRAIEAGAVELRPLKDQFYGDRSGSLRDPYGHHWTIATHTEDVTPEQIAERLAAMGQQE